MKKTVKELKAMFESGKLKTDITTQRGFIYSSETITNDEDEIITRAGDVIKSILERDIQLPAIYFWSVQDDEKGIHYADDEFNLHDGKQRLLSIFNFIYGTVTTKLNGRDVTFADLTEEQEEKLANYEIDIVVKAGTKAQEEKSFKIINRRSMPLTIYEALKGCYYGKYLTEFENYLENLNFDKIRAIGRGEQAIWLLYLALGCINEEKNKLEVYASDKLRDCRNNSFDATVRNFDKKIKFYAELLNLGMAGKDCAKNPQKFCQIANYVIDKNYDTFAVLDYYRRGLSELNDIEKWKFQMHKIALDNLASGIRNDYRRFFSKDDKDSLFTRSQRCAKCGETLGYNELEVDHITPWSRGGRTNLENAQLLCKSCNSSKGAN